MVSSGDIYIIENWDVLPYSSYKSFISKFWFRKYNLEQLNALIMNSYFFIDYIEYTYNTDGYVYIIVNLSIGQYLNQLKIKTSNLDFNIFAFRLELLNSARNTFSGLFFDTYKNNKCNFNWKKYGF